MPEALGALLIDLDGVLYVEDEPIPGAWEAVARPRAEGLGLRFVNEVLNRAFRSIMAGAELIALQKNRFWLRADGLSLDVGPFVAALEYATGAPAYVVGKPAKEFFDEVLADLGVAAEAAAMIGDDVESDIGGALRVGLRGILVRTGKYLKERVRASGIRPTAVVESIGDVPELIGA